MQIHIHFHVLDAGVLLVPTYQGVS